MMIMVMMMYDDDDVEGEEIAEAYVGSVDGTGATSVSGQQTLNCAT